MANYLLCHKEFKSLGKSYIELADININTVSVQIDGKSNDRTNFLKYGSCYKDKQEQKNIIIVEIEIDLVILNDNIGYYFKYTGDLINQNDKLSFNKSNSNKKIFCVVTFIKEENYYFEFFDKVENDVPFLRCDCLSIYKYECMKESTCLYELFIKDDINNSIINNIIPFFMPKMTQNMSSEKKILIHVSKDIPNFSILFTSYYNYYMNNLEYNEELYLDHIKEHIDNPKNYKTYSISFIYNGNKSWFMT